jgi:hypothetical protein
MTSLETCSLKQNNVISFVVLDGLYKYTDSLICNGMDSIKLLRVGGISF